MERNKTSISRSSHPTVASDNNKHVPQSTECSKNTLSDEKLSNEYLHTNKSQWQSKSAGKQKSTIWAFFHYTEDLGQAQDFAARCLVRSRAISYKRKNGTSSLINHVQLRHAKKYNGYLSYTKTIQKTDRKLDASKLQTSLIRPLLKNPYDSSSIVQQRFNKNLSLFCTNSLRPFSIVECQWFAKMIHGIDSRIKLPSRRTFTEQMVNGLATDVRKRLRPNLNEARFITITFKLWMSRGCADTFSVIAHWRSSGTDGLKRYSKFLKLMQVDSTTGSLIASELNDILRSYSLTNKIVAYVTDGGANLATCTQELIGLVDCAFLNLSSMYHGSCWAHVFSNMCKKSFAAVHYDGLAHVNLKSLRSKLQSAITWTKKSGKGNRIWRNSCVKASLKPVQLYTPVKTRFGSVYIMFNQMLKYRDAVQYCYSHPENTTNSHREPSSGEWTIVRFVCNVMKPLLDACLFNQSKHFWCISDAVALALDLISSFTVPMQEGSGAMEDYDALSPLQKDLVSWKERVSHAFVLTLKKHLPCLFNTERRKSFIPTCGHCVISLMLDPRYKSMSILLRALDVCSGEEIIAEYDEAILNQLVHVYKKENNIPDAPKEAFPNASNPTNATSGSTQTQTEESHSFFKAFDQDSDDTIMQLMRNELHRYRLHKYDAGRRHSQAMDWLHSIKKTYPNVFLLSTAYLSIPASQIDNERAFSIAGVVTAQRRSRMGMKNVDNILQVYHNYDAAGVVEALVQKESKDISDLAAKEAPLISDDELQSDLE